MKYRVVYFTRTGNSRRVAEKIAAELSVEAAEITDHVNWKGFFGFLKGGYYASTDKDVEINLHESLNHADELIVVTPLWAGKVAPAIRTFLKDQTLERVHLVVVSSGSKLKNRSGYHSVNDIVKNDNNEETVIHNLINRLHS